MSLLGKFTSVGGATLSSRILGFVREVLIAALLGTGPVADAFYAAFRFPNLFRRLFAEGAFNAAFIPLFARELENGGQTAAREFGEKILSVLLPILLLLTALSMIFMPFLIGSVIAPKFTTTPDKFELTVTLARIMFPYLAAMSLVAMMSGILNAFRKYFLAAMAPIILNIVLIALLILAYNQQASPERIGLMLAWGVFGAGLLQLGMLIWGVRQQKFGLSLRLPILNPAVKQLLVLAVPTAIAGGITQINLLVGQIIASAQNGAIAIMNYADRLIQLPLGIVGISIGVVLLPELSRVLGANKPDKANHLQNQSLELGLGLTIPAAVGLFMIPLPLVVLLFERGAFERESAEITAQVLAAFAIGLPSFVMIKIFQPSFYAREDMKTPMWLSAGNAIFNIILSVLLFPHMGVVGLAVATSMAGWLNAIGLALLLHVGKHFTVTPRTLVNIVLIGFSSLAMAAMLHGGEMWAGDMLTDEDLPTRLLLISGLIMGASIVYFSLVIITGAVPLNRFSRTEKPD